ncbi:MAG TPA: peptidylprolyl isomerase [Bryobacteraceae bacterium]|nr:peptidylprolyl isomerase [Bryobacteraceae bacterium]
MKFFCYFAFSLAGLLPAQNTPASKPPDLTPDTVVGTTGDKKLTVGEITKLIEYLPAQLRQGYNQDPKGFLSQWFMLQRMVALAEAQKIPEKSPYKEALEVQRMTFLMQALLQDKAQKLQVSLEEQQKYYEQKKDDYTQAKVKLIYIPFVAAQNPAADPSKKTLTETEALAKAEGVVKAAREGKDFVELVRENSEDPISKEKAGDFGPIKRGDRLPDAIKGAVFQLKPGAVSDPVRQANGYYVFRMMELVGQPFADVKDAIAAELRNQTVKAWVEQNSKETQLKVERPDFFTPPKQ